MESALATAPVSSDRELVERVRYSDPEAFDLLYQRYGGMVYNLALRMTANPEDAADLTQETFLRVFRHLGGFGGKSSLRTWIYRVALNACRSRLRKRSRRRGILPTDPSADVERAADSRSTPERRALTHDLGLRLSEALEQLPLAFREAVVLRDVEGLTYDEIAVVLSIRPGTVRSRIARGRERLRVMLEDLG